MDLVDLDILVESLKDRKIFLEQGGTLGYSDEIVRLDKLIKVYELMFQQKLREVLHESI